MAETRNIGMYQGEERRATLLAGGMLPRKRPDYGRYRCEEKFDWEHAVATLRKNRRIAIIFGLGVALSSIFVSWRLKDIYEPVARVEIDPPGSGLLSSQQRDTADPSGADYLETQIQILKSDALAMKVIRKLKLDQKRAFVGAAAPIYQFSENHPRPIDPQLVVPPAARPMAVVDVVDIERIESSDGSDRVIDAPASTIQRLRAERTGAGTKVLIQGDGRLDGKLTPSTLPGRLILDFRGVRLHVDAQSGAWTRNSDLPGLGGIRSGHFRPDVARVVLDLREPVEYVVTPDSDAIVVTLKTPDHKLGSLVEPGSNSAPPAAREAERRESADTAGGARNVGYLNPNDARAAASLPERPAEEVDPTKQMGQGLEAVSSDGERTPNENLALRFFRQNLTVSTSRNSRIVEVSLASSDPQLATEATNTLVHSFIDSDYRTRYETTMRSSDWLTEQLASLREKVRENNQALAEYQKQTGVVDPEEKDNPLLAKADELNRQYSQAEADRIQSEAYTRAADEGNADSLPQIRDNLLIQSLSQRLAESRAQLARALTIYGENNSSVKRLRGESDELSAQLGTAKRAMVGGLKANYKAALTRERLMAQAAEEMKATLGSMDEKMARYRLLKNQAQTSTELFNTLQSRLKEAGIYAGLRSENIRVVDLAAVPDRPAGPHRLLDITIGLFAALVGGAALAFIKESMNNRVRTPEDVARWTAMPSLPMIPEIPLANGLGPRLRLYRGGKHALRNGNGAEAIARLPRLFSADALTPEADAINNLRTSILISRGDSGRRVLLVVGTSPRTGSTTIAANLAMALAKRGKTCLVDADLRRPMVSRAFALAPAIGLCEVLRGDASLEKALAVAPHTGGLSLLLGGRIPVNPLDLLTGETMREVMRVLRERFEFVVVDSPPAIPFPDCRFLASISDEVVLVSRSGKTSRRTLVRSAELIDEVQAPLLGVVVNGVDVDSADYRYYTCSNGKDAYPKNGKRYQPSIAVAAGNGFKAKPNAV